MMNTKKIRWALWWERFLGAFKYLMGFAMVWSGYNAATEPLTPVDSLGFIYQSRTALVVLGIIFALCGLALLYGKFRKSRKWTGYGLMGIFCCFVFAVTANAMAFGLNIDSNLILMFVMGLLYLRWRFKTAYINPKHFRDESERLAYEHHRLAP